MASATDLSELDQLGAVLTRLGHDYATLTIAREHGRVSFHLDLPGADGRFHCGMGGTPSEALVDAEAKLAGAGRVRAVANA